MSVEVYHKSSIRPPGGLFIFFSPRGGLKREGAYYREGGLLKFKVQKSFKNALAFSCYKNVIQICQKTSLAASKI